MIYIGIDNGLSGALVAIQGHKIVHATVMPLSAKNKGDEVCGKSIHTWINMVRMDGPVMVALEVPGKFAKGAMSLCSMWDSYGCIRGVLESCDIRFTAVHPRSWQAKMLPGCEKGNTKPVAKSKAKRLWPSQQWRRTPLCKTDHDGLIDAALIAEFARINNL